MGCEDGLSESLVRMKNNMGNKRKMLWVLIISFFKNNSWMEHISKACTLYTYIFYFLESTLGA